VTVVFAGGGTGGHLYPAIAIADALRPRATIAFIGSADRLETTIVPKAGYPLHTVSAHALPRRLSFDLLRAVARNVKGTLQSLSALSGGAPRSRRRNGRLRLLSGRARGTHPKTRWALARPDRLARTQSRARRNHAVAGAHRRRDLG
jgi:hypothetical protein